MYRLVQCEEGKGEDDERKHIFTNTFLQFYVHLIFSSLVLKTRYCFRAKDATHSQSMKYFALFCPQLPWLSIVGVRSAKVLQYPLQVIGDSAFRLSE